MSEKIIVTIGRQFGSGGHEIAAGVAEALSIPLYDKEIIVEAAKKSGMNEALFHKADERTVTSFLYSIAMGAYTPANAFSGMNMNETIFQTQANVIEELAQRGSCVFVGRCADYVLREMPEAYHLFVYADLSQRIERVERLYQLDADKAEALIVKTDKKRANYYNYYTGERWNAAEHYDVCLNSGKIGVAGCVEAILAYIRLAQQNRQKGAAL